VIDKRLSMHNHTTMKVKAFIRCLIPLLGLGFAWAAQAQSGGGFDLTWFSIDGGGGVSTGGVYSVSGTIGQPDAGAMTGGNFSLVGGFWSVLGVVPEPGAPALEIRRTSANTVVIAWPNPSTGFELQENSNLSTTNWVSGPSPIVVPPEKQVIISPPVGTHFYRLKKTGP
jgi:hypothetical protein